MFEVFEVESCWSDVSMGSEDVHDPHCIIINKSKNK